MALCIFCASTKVEIHIAVNVGTFPVAELSDFSDVSHLKTSKSICTQNFDDIALSAAEILLFPFSETNGRHIESLLPVFTLTFSSSSACDYTSAHQISFKSDRPRPSYDVITIFKMAAVSHVGFAVA